MFEKIITGAQSGAERAALDVALKFHIPYGGWIPRRRMTEDGLLPDKYKMQELSTSNFNVCSKMNVLDSQGTVVITNGDFNNGLRLAKMYADQFDRCWLHIDLGKIPVNWAASKIHDWMIMHEIEILNVTGSKLKEYSKIYSKVLIIMEGFVKQIF